MFAVALLEYDLAVEVVAAGGLVIAWGSRSPLTPRRGPISWRAGRWPAPAQGVTHR
jgi:hypothetical protein